MNIGKLLREFCVATVLFLFCSSAFAGIDLSGKVERLQIKDDGDLWIKLDNAAFDQYCLKGWYSLNLYIPATSKAFPYYYGLFTTAMASNKTVFIANISKYDGTAACDLTKTGYGVVLRNQ